MSEQILNTIQSLTTALIPVIVTIIAFVCRSSEAILDFGNDMKGAWSGTSILYRAEGLHKVWG